jgi:hypothetical protein
MLSTRACGELFVVKGVADPSFDALAQNWQTGKGIWIHLAFVFRRRNAFIYVNGMLTTQEKDEPGELPKVNTTRLYNYFGKSHLGTFSYVLLDEIKIYKLALNQHQIKIDMNTVGIPLSW